MKNIFVLGGFLGSGKTTFLMQFARYLTEHEPGKLNKVVIIENEIGETGIDDKMLKGSAMEVKNLFAGCVCCSISGELEYTLAQIIKDLDPDYIVLEATGLAYPENIKQNIKKNLEIDCITICIADAQRWLRLVVPMKTLLPIQLEGADYILLSKIDLVDEQTLEEDEKSVRQFNEKACILRVNSKADIVTVLDSITFNR